MWLSQISWATRDKPFTVLYSAYLLNGLAIGKDVFYWDGELAQVIFSDLISVPTDCFEQNTLGPNR